MPVSGIQWRMERVKQFSSSTFLIRELGINQIIIYMNKRCTYGNAIYYSALKILNRGIWHRDVKEYLLKEVILNCSENNEELWK